MGWQISRRTGVVVLSTLVIAGASVGAARGAVRYAAPIAQGTGNCGSALNACTLAAAVSGSSQGDTVMLAGDQGSYGTPASPLTATITDPAPDAPGAIEGTPGEPRPVVYTNATFGFDLTGTATVGGQQQATSVSNLDIEELGTSSPTGLFVQGNVDHVVVRSPNSAYDACAPLGLAPPQTEVISNSLCVAGGLNATALGIVSTGSGTPQPTDIELRNDTLYATGSGSRALSFSVGDGIMVSVAATNVIARGVMDDVVANQFSGSGVTIALDHSNYATVSQGAGTTITPAGTGSNQTADPKFANAAANDFHESAGSPTIDAGIASPANGATDLDGIPRTIGRSTDIGAFEAAEAPTVVPAAPTAIGPNAAKLNVSVNPNFSATTVQGYLGARSSSEAPLPTQPAGGGIALVTLPFSTAALKPDTTHHYHFVATNALGTSATSDGTFTTARATGKVRLPRKALVRKSKARVRLSCSHASSCAGTLSLEGVGKGSFSIAAGGTVTVVVKLSGKARHALAHSRHHRLKVVATVRRSDGGPGTHAKVELVR